MPLIQVSGSDEESVRSIIAELAHDSDRAAGIVGAVLVEESLTTLIRSRLIADEESLRELTLSPRSKVNRLRPGVSGWAKRPKRRSGGFRASGPLGAFSVKIRLAFLLGLYSATAQNELNTIKEIRNEFAHRVARSFSFERIRDLANNLSLSEQVEFHIVHQKDQAVIWIGAKPPADQPSEPIVHPSAPEKMTPRERYLHACQFYGAALLFTAQAMPKNFHNTYF
jgi:hypothetical protein